MARKNAGACGNLKLIKADVDGRAARPKFSKGAWSPANISDVTGGGLYLFVTPDKSRPGNAASELWRMPHYRATRSTSACGCLALIQRLIIAPTDSGPPSRPLSHRDEIKDAKARDGDVVELQLAHLDNSTAEGLYKKHGQFVLISSRTKLDAALGLIGSTTGSIPTEALLADLRGK